MYCLIEGTVAGAKIKTPESGKAHRAVSVLQQVDGEAVLVVVKDMEMREYGEGEAFSKFCRVTNWSFDGKSGMSCYVIHREKAKDSAVYGNQGEVV